MENLFLELGTILIIATVFGFFIRNFKQPLILAYILTGIVVGPTFLDLIKSTEVVATLSHVGIAFLLFIVGVDLNFRILKDLGMTALITGIGQVLFTAIIGYFIMIAFGFSSTIALYVGVALTFSSTIIIVKLLSDKNDLDTLYGKISIGILLIQDFIVIIILLILGGLSTTTSITSLLTTTLIKGALLFVVVLFATKFLLPKIFEKISKSQELLFLSSISWCLLMAVMSYLVGFSVEIGALLAGISLSTLPYHYEIAGRVKPVRDFFLVLFFVLLGAQMKFLFTSSIILIVAILSIFILIGKPLITMILMGLFGYKKRTSFFTGLTLAQISEFSLILMAVGVSLGHLSQEITTIVTMIGLITIALSTYLITYSEKLYEWLGMHLNIFERRLTYERRYLHLSKSRKYDIVLIGCNRIGHNIVKNSQKIKKSILVVDFNPDVIKKFVKSKVDALYGDIADVEILEKIFRFKPRIVISTIPSFEDNFFIVKKFKKKNKNSLVIVTGKNIHRAIELYENGADFVILPEFLAGQKVVDYLIHLDKYGIKKWGKHYYNVLLEDKNRKEI